MGIKEFVSTIDGIFDRFEVANSPLFDRERPLDELFDDPVVVIRWSAGSREEIPDISPVLKLADREDMVLVDRTLEFPVDETSSETPQLSERLKFEHRL
ncbi:hypothetical protein ACOZ4I_14425 [Haloarcula salina]|uniref:hypothetical protein n=1 Tax=Haloarcula salina TaxID=1429914 RepID=UPI003C6FD6A1